MSKTILLTLMLISAGVLVSACNDDDEGVNGPGNTTPYPTMANIWPHADGTAWTYDLEYREFEQPVENEIPDGEIPSMEALHAALQGPMAGNLVVEGEGLYRFAFDGMQTTQSGAVGQKVVETFYVEMPGGPFGSTQEAPSVSDRTLAMIARARPDLRDAIALNYGLDEKDFETITPPYFMGGYAFAYEDSGYFGYADIDGRHSWVYLEGDLSVGSEFELQLVPLLANDIWLRGRVWSIGKRTLAGVTYGNVLECLYLLDFGETYFRTAYGGEEGPYYPYIYGNVLFVPGLGPAAGVERRLLYGDAVLQDTTVSRIEYVLDRVGATFPD